MQSFGERLKALRKSRGITQEKLARDMNIPESTIRRIETQEEGTPRTDRINDLASYFGVSTDFLLGREKDEKAASEQTLSQRRLTAENSIAEKYGFDLNNPDDYAIVEDLIRTAARIKGYKIIDE